MMDLSQIGCVPFSKGISVPNGQESRRSKLQDLEKSMKDRLKRFNE